MLFSPVFASPHLRPFAASPLLATSRIERPSRLISSIFRLHNSFRMSAHFARFLHHLSPFRMNTSRSVHSKQLYLPLESTLMKKGGRGIQLLLTRNAKKHFYPERPSGVKELSAWHSQSCLCSSTRHGSRNTATPRIMCAPLQESTPCAIATSAAPDGTSVKLVTACGDWLAGPAPTTPNPTTLCSAPSISAAISLTPP